MAAKEKNLNNEIVRMFSGENDAQLLTEQGSVSASASLQPSGIVGGKSTLEKCDSWGKGNPHVRMEILLEKYKLPGDQLSC